MAATTATNILVIKAINKNDWKAPSLLEVLLLILLLLSSSASDSNSSSNSIVCTDGDDNGKLVCMNKNNTNNNSDDEHDDDDTNWDDITSTYKRQCIRVLKERKAHLCWHKHSTFLEHLVSVHDILARWIIKKASPSSPNKHIHDDHKGDDPTIIPRIGLFHSAYSNSYVNLALFNVTSERHVLQKLIGIEAEEYVYIFCSINRQEVVVNTLLRQKFIPPEGLRVPHLRHTNETIYLSSKTLYILLIFTMADIADQYFDWQDLLFGGGNTDGSMILPGYDIYVERHNTKALWPGLSKPGLWMSYVSQLGQVARTYHNSTITSVATTLDIPILPPVFHNGINIVLPSDELEARDLYWSVISGTIIDEIETIATLQSCSEKNPYIFEPLVLLAQVYAHQNDYTSTIMYASKALDVQQQWGIAWDKRMSFDAWMAWTKVLLQRAQQQLPWPTNAWDVNNLGYVY